VLLVEEFYSPNLSSVCSFYNSKLYEILILDIIIVIKSDRDMNDVFEIHRKDLNFYHK